MTTITALTTSLIDPVREMMGLGSPYISVRTTSDYWLYARLFANTCPVALDDGHVVGAVISFRSQTDPDEVYIQDVMVHPGHRRRGIASALIESVIATATTWGCQYLLLTSEPNNDGAHATWTRLGFTNDTGDINEGGRLITRDFKGEGRHRAVYRRRLA